MLRHVCILGIPNKGEQNQKWLPHPYLLGGTKRAGNATSPLHSWDPQQRGTKSKVAASPLPSRGPTWGRKCYVTLAFSRIPNAKRGEQKTEEGSPTKGNKIRGGCVSPIFSGSQTGQEMLRHPCMLGIPNKGGKNQQWLPHPCLLGGPKEGGNATSRLHSRDPQQRGTKSEVAASPLIFIFLVSRSRIKRSQGRVTKKVYFAFFLNKKSVTRFLIFFWAVGHVSEKA